MGNIAAGGRILYNPTMKSSDLRLRLGSEKDAPEVLEIYKTSPDYFQKVDGCEPSLETARTEITFARKARAQIISKSF